MIISKELRRKVWQAGYTNSFWGWSAIAQLPALLEDDESIEKMVSGLYDGGHAVLVATNKRIIFMDKKVMSFKVEDIHYEMVSEVEHRMGIFTARLRLRCLSNNLEITSLSQKNIRAFAMFIDAKVNKIRLNMRTWEEMIENSNTNEGHGSVQLMPSRRSRTIGRYASLRRP
jgi:hypothetical protein